MRMSWGPGPVFAFESLIAARRWQLYALRSVYVSLLLVGLTLTWGPSQRTVKSLAEAAAIGRLLLHTVIAVQLGMVLLAAPAATAGTICVDKARGTLLHTFVTDLTDREIVLGKLGARLAPVLALMAYGLPVLALGSFLGGIDLAAALGAELVTAGVAILCCTLALMTSLWARKPHQALLLAYALVGLWVGLVPAVIILFHLGPPTTIAGPGPVHVQPDHGRVRARDLPTKWVGGPARAGGVLPRHAPDREWPGWPGELAAAADGPRPGEPAPEAQAARCTCASSIICRGPRLMETRCSGASGTANGPRAGQGGSGRLTPSSRRWRACTSWVAITSGGAMA